MPRVASRALLFVSLALVSLAAGVWLRQLVAPPADPGPPPVELATLTGPGGVRFEVEHRPNEFVSTSTDDIVEFRRGPDLLDYADDVLTVNGTGFPSPKAGDLVRWNLDGPLLVNGQPVQPHPLQPRLLPAPGIDLRWDIRGPSPSPRDTLSVGWPRAGRTLLTANGDGTARLWDADKYRERTLITSTPPKDGKGGWGLRAAVSPDGKRVATANTLGGGVTLWDADTGKEVGPVPGPAGKVNGLAFLSDGWLLVAQGGELTARRLAGDRPWSEKVGAVHGGFVMPFAVGADGKTVAANDGGKVTVYRLTVGPDKVGVAWGNSVRPVTDAGCLAVSPDGGLVAVFDGTSRLALYDAATGQPRQRLRWRATGDGVRVTALAFAPDGKTLAAGDDTSVRLYDVPSGRERGWVASPPVRVLAYSADGATLAAGLEHAPGVRLWPTADLQAK